MLRSGRHHFRLRVALLSLLAVAAPLAVTGCQKAPTALQGTLQIGSTTAPANMAVAVFADSSESLVAETFTDPAGRYHFSTNQVTPGTYRVRFGDGSWYSGATDWADATSVVVAKSPATVLDAAINAPTGAISGALTRQSGRPIANATVTAAPIGDPAKTVATATTDAQGAYHLTGLSSMRLILHFTAVGYAQTWSGGAAVASAATPLTSDGTTSQSGVDAVLDPEATLTGQLTGSANGWGGIAVMAYDKATGELVGGAGIGPYGNFTIGGLAAGTYTISVIDPSGEFQNEVVGSTTDTPTTGTSYTVTAGATKAVGRLTVHGADCPLGAANSDLSGVNLTGANLRNCDLNGAILNDANLTGADLRGATLVGAKARNATMAGARLDGASFFVADVSGANFDGASVQATTFHAAGVQGTDFGTTALKGIRSGDLAGTPARLPSGWSLHNGYFVGPGADVSGANFTGLDLSGLDLSGLQATLTNFTNASLNGTNLAHASFYGATLTGANLSGTNLTGASLTQIVSGGISGTPATMPTGWVLYDGTLFGQWTTVTGANVEGADLSGADLAGVTSGELVGTPAALPTGWAFTDGYLVGPAATVTGANVDGVDLSTVNLHNVTSGGLSGTPSALPTGWTLFNGYLVGPGANLSHAQLPGLSAPGIDLSHTNLMYTDLTGANLTGANLTGSHLDVSDLSNANFTGADLTGAILAQANLSGTDFTSATLTQIYSRLITGVPAALPVGRVLVSGYLICPGAEIVAADLSGADLSGIDLSGADLRLVDLTSTNLAGADLSNVNLSGATMTATTLSGTTFASAVLDDVHSSGLAGTPASLPNGWIVLDGVLVAPNG